MRILLNKREWLSRHEAKSMWADAQATKFLIEAANIARYFASLFQESGEGLYRSTHLTQNQKISWSRKFRILAKLHTRVFAKYF